MVNHHLVVALYKDTIALFCAASIAISPGYPSPGLSRISDPASYSNPGLCKQLSTISSRGCTRAGAVQSPNASEMTTELWRYLRKGINYLEASGKDLPLNFRHPGGHAYGPLALSPVAFKDVQAYNPRLKKYSFEDVISKRSLYEKAAFLYAELLLRHYIKIDYSGMSKEEVFMILQKAWFLGPTLYLKGHGIIASREIKAAKYVKV